MNRKNFLVKFKKLIKTGFFSRVLISIGIILIIALVLWNISMANLNNEQNSGTEKINGHKPYIIVSNSMEPRIKVSGMIVVKGVPYDELKKDDIISFTVDTTDPNIQGKVITHRIYDFTLDGGIITKGDNNATPDSWIVTEKNVKGKVTMILNWVRIYNDRGKINILAVIFFFMIPLVIIVFGLEYIFKRIRIRLNKSRKYYIFKQRLISYKNILLLKLGITPKSSKEQMKIDEIDEYIQENEEFYLTEDDIKSIDNPDFAHAINNRHINSNRANLRDYESERQSASYVPSAEYRHNRNAKQNAAERDLELEMMYASFLKETSPTESAAIYNNYNSNNYRSQEYNKNNYTETSYNNYTSPEHSRDSYNKTSYKDNYLDINIDEIDYKDIDLSNINIEYAFANTFNEDKYGNSTKLSNEPYLSDDIDVNDISDEYLEFYLDKMNNEF